MAPLFSGIDVQVLANTFPLLLTCTAVALLANCMKGFCSFTIVICKNLLVFYFAFLKYV